MFKKRISRTRGHLDASSLKLVVVYSRFNELLTDSLLGGAYDELLKMKAKEKNIKVVEVPGAFEIPLTVKKALKKFKPDAVLTLSVVIRGATKHFDQVVYESAQGIRELSLTQQTPIILGMIAADNIDDARNRVGIKQQNQGRQWAQTAVETANLMKQLGNS